MGTVPPSNPSCNLEVIRAHWLLLFVVQRSVDEVISLKDVGSSGELG